MDCFMTRAPYYKSQEQTHTIKMALETEVAAVLNGPITDNFELIFEAR